MFIETKNLIKTYKGRNVVDGVSIRVAEGEVVGLLGPNGAGKTTTFYMIVGIEKPNDGDIFIGGKEITRMPMYKRADQGIGYLPQEASIFRNLSVEDNIRAMLQTTDLSKKEIEETVESLLEEFHIAHVRTRKGMQLSGGERRRVEIARCIALAPRSTVSTEGFGSTPSISMVLIPA